MNLVPQIEETGKFVKAFTDSVGQSRSSRATYGKKGRFMPVDGPVVREDPLKKNEKRPPKVMSEAEQAIEQAEAKISMKRQYKKRDPGIAAAKKMKGDIAQGTKGEKKTGSKLLDFKDVYS